MAELKIYDSIADEEPSKVYKCLRTTMAINNRLEELTDEVNALDKEITKELEAITDNTTAKELKEIEAKIYKIKERMNQNTLECIRLFFPDFTDDDYLKMDPYDYQSFINEIIEMRNNIYNRAAKN